jgi:hypothetical protein
MVSSSVQRLPNHRGVGVHARARNQIACKKKKTERGYVSNKTIAQGKKGRRGIEESTVKINKMS